MNTTTTFTREGNTISIIGTPVSITLTAHGETLFGMGAKLNKVNWAGAKGTNWAEIDRSATECYVSLCDLATAAHELAIRKANGGAMNEHDKVAMRNARQLVARNYREFSDLFGVRNVGSKTANHCVSIAENNIDFLLVDIRGKKEGQYCSYSTYLERLAKSLRFLMQGGTPEKLSDQDATVGSSSKGGTRANKVAELNEQIEALKADNVKLQTELGKAEELGAEAKADHDMIAALRLYMAENAGKIEESAIRGILKMTKKAK